MCLWYHLETRPYMDIRTRSHHTRVSAVQLHCASLVAFFRCPCLSRAHLRAELGFLLDPFLFGCEIQYLDEQHLKQTLPNPVFVLFFVFNNIETPLDMSADSSALYTRTSSQWALRLFDEARVSLVLAWAISVGVGSCFSFFWLERFRKVHQT